ncbi:hypothetical protein YC2023_084883 [Brassica napus]
MQKNVSGDLTAKKSNGKVVVSSAEPNSGDLTSRKPSGKAVASSVEPIVRAGFTGVSPVSVSGDPKSKKLNGKAVVSSADPISGDLTVKKPNGKDVDSSAEPIKRAGHTIISPVPVVSGDPKSKQKNGKAVVTSAKTIKRTGNAGGSCADVVSGKLTPKKLKGKAVDSSSVEVLFFKDVKFRPQEGELRFRLIHFWEARNTHTKILIGIEMILIDEQGTVIQGFIPPSRIDTYLPHMIAGSLYRLIKFYGSKSKTMYRVSEQDVTISFSWNSVLSVLENCPVQFVEDRFRFYGYEEFESACDLKGDLYGLVDLEAAVCLCTALKADLLGLKLDVPISLSVILNQCVLFHEPFKLNSKHEIDATD